MKTNLIRRFAAPMTVVLLGTMSTLGTFASAAPMTPRITDGQDLSEPVLYTEASWEKIMLPMTDATWRLPDDLTLESSGLPEGVTVTLIGATETSGMIELSVATERSDTSVPVDSVGTFTLMSGETEVASFQLPVQGVAQASE
jgi:hypothetical protein